MPHESEMEIDALLRTELDLPADDGFCQQLIASLPPRRIRHTWVLPSGMLAGAVLAAATVVASGLPPAAVICAAAGMSVLAALWVLDEVYTKELTGLLV